jgi:hypothetical protein
LLCDHCKERNVIVADKYATTLDECEARLLEFRQLLHTALEQGCQQDEPQAVTLTRTIDFGLQTVQTVRLLITDDASHALAVCATVRALLEGSIRLLWATRTVPGAQNPWCRIQRYWAEQDMKWASEASRLPGTKQHAQLIETTRNEVLSRTDASGNPYVPASGIQQLLSDIDRADHGQGLITQKILGDELYTNMYRVLCRATHAHPEALRVDQRATYVRHARIGLVIAMWYLLQACCHVGTDDPKLEITALAARLKEVMEEDHE